MIRRRVLILGGTRYFGKGLVELCLQNGDEVTIATRGLTLDGFEHKVQRLIIDREYSNKIEEVLADKFWDIVYDQICYSSIEARDICKALNQRTKRLILTSTQSVYLNNEEQLEEDFDPYNYPIEYKSKNEVSYSEGKRGAEAVFFQSKASSVAAVRFPIVLGENDYTKRLEFHINHVKSGIPLVIPNLDAKTSFISAEDASKFLFWLGDLEFQGPINACFSGAISIGEIIEMIEVRTKTKAKIVSNGKDEHRSPFVGETSRFMNSNLAVSKGFSFTEIKPLLHDLIDRRCR